MTSFGNPDISSALFDPQPLRKLLIRKTLMLAPRVFLMSASKNPFAERLEDPLKLRIPGPRTGELMELAASGELFTWRESVRALQHEAGVEIDSRTKSIARVPFDYPQLIVVHSWEEAIQLDRALAGRRGEQSDLARDLQSLFATASAVNTLAATFDPQPDLPTKEIWFRALSKVKGSQLDATVDALAFLNSEERAGRTLRELPVPHFGTKWVERNVALISAVLGFDPREQARGRITRVGITYADPSHISQASSRTYDSLVSGDFYIPPYTARAILISENDECADMVPPFDGLIAARGHGKNVLNVARTLTEFFPHTPIVYWGDIDEEGLAILSHLRSHFPEVRSILMDEDAWHAHSHLGVPSTSNDDIERLNRTAPNLTDAERLALHKVTSSGTPAPRIEQERIPRHSVIAALANVLDALQLTP